MGAQIIPLEAFMPNTPPSNVVPFPSNVTPLQREAARGVGRGLVALPGGGAATTQPLVGRPLGILAPVIALSPFAREAWERYLPNAIPVFEEVPSPLIPPGTGAIRFIVTSTYSDTVLGGTGTDTRDVTVGNASSLIRGPYVGVEAEGSGVYVRVRDEFGVARVLAISTFTSPLRYKFESIQSAEVFPILPGYPNPLPVSRPPTVPNQNPNFNPNVPLRIPLNPIPGVLPYPVTLPYVMPSPVELPNHPIPLIPDYEEPGERPFEIPPMWLHPDGLQIGPGNNPILYLPTYGVPDTVGDELRDLQRRLINRGADGCCPVPDIGDDDCPTLDEIRAMVEEELDERIKKPPEYDPRETSYSPSGGRNVPLPARTKKVTLTVTQKPTNARTQSGRNSQSVFYCGWCSFNDGERIPIHYLNSTFFPPSEEATNFSYTVYSGFLAEITVYYEVELPPEQ